MAASGRCSSKRGLLAAALLACGCVEELPPIEGTQSIRVELTSPDDPGSFEERLADDDRDVSLSLTALDADNQVDVGFSGDVDIYVHYLGSLTPELGEVPLATVSMQDGLATADLELPPVFGPTFLWAEHASGDMPTYATGTSPVIWYRDPYLVDVSRPEDEEALDALERSPLEDKQVSITTSRYGDVGRMVVTGVYAQGYTLSDVSCADSEGTPPCETGDYDHIFVFSFSRPEDERGRAIQVGQSIRRLAGSVAEFNGLTEISFPQSFVVDAPPRPEQLPEPVVLQPEWVLDRIPMERVEAALVAIEDAELCPLDEDFETYAQWKLDIGHGCTNRAINIITQGQVAEFEPEDYVGMTIPRVVGTLRPVNIGTFHVWIVYPRNQGDLTLP